MGSDVLGDAIKAALDALSDVDKANRVITMRAMGNEIEDYIVVAEEGVPEAPVDGNQYARKDSDWEQVAIDLTDYYNKVVSDGRFLGITANAVSATKLLTARNIALTGDVTGNVNFDGSGDVEIAATVVSPGITDAPSDGEQYARKDAAWEIVEPTGGITTFITNPNFEDDLTGWTATGLAFAAETTNELVGTQSGKITLTATVDQTLDGDMVIGGDAFEAQTWKIEFYYENDVTYVNNTVDVYLLCDSTEILVGQLSKNSQISKFLGYATPVTATAYKLRFKSSTGVVNSSTIVIDNMVVYVQDTLALPDRNLTVSVDENYTVEPDVNKVFVDTTSGDITITIPVDEVIGTKITIVKISGDANTLNIVRSGSEVFGPDAVTTLSTVIELDHYILVKADSLVWDYSPSFDQYIRGKLGIGTDVLTYALNVVAPTGEENSLSLDTTDNDVDTRIRLLKAGVLKWIFGNDHSDSDKFKIGVTGWSSPIVVIDPATGNVGFGVAPSNRLDVLQNLTGVYAVRIRNTHATGHGSYIIGGSTSTTYSLVCQNSSLQNQLLINGHNTTSNSCTNGTWASTSDKRLKEDIRDITNPIDKAIAIANSTKHFKFKSNADLGTVQRTQYIAQELIANGFEGHIIETPPPSVKAGEMLGWEYEEVIIYIKDETGKDTNVIESREWKVTKEGEKFLSVEQNFAPYAFPAIKALNEKIEVQQTEIESLKSEVTELKSMVQQLLNKEN